MSDELFAEGYVISPTDLTLSLGRDLLPHIGGRPGIRTRKNPD